MEDCNLDVASVGARLDAQMLPRHLTVVDPHARIKKRLFAAPRLSADPSQLRRTLPFLQPELFVKDCHSGLFISFALFIAKIERQYVNTFFSTESGHARTKRYFLEGEDDFIKHQVLTNNRYQWTSIRPQVAEWLDENWDKWERDKPDWFNPLFIDIIDDDIMPARVLARLKQEAEGGVRRRSSFMERVSVRVQERENDEEGSESDGSDGEDAR